MGKENGTGALNPAVRCTHLKVGPSHLTQIVGAQRLINLELAVLVRSLKSSHVELGNGRLFQGLSGCCC